MRFASGPGGRLVVHALRWRRKRVGRSTEPRSQRCTAKLVLLAGQNNRDRTAKGYAPHAAWFPPAWCVSDRRQRRMHNCLLAEPLGDRFLEPRVLSPALV